MVTLVQSTRVQSAGGASTVVATYGSATIKGNLLIAAYGLDKAAGTITPPSGFTTVLSNSSASVSIYVGYKVADGTETSLTLTRGTANVSGDTGWISEWSDGPSGPWTLYGSANNYTNETTVNSAATGTTGTINASNGHALSFAAIDTGNNATANLTWSASFTQLLNWTFGTDTGQGDIAIGQLLPAPVAATLTTTGTYTGTADQLSAGIMVFGRLPDLNGIGATRAAAWRRPWANLRRSSPGRAPFAAAAPVPPVWVPQRVSKRTLLLPSRRARGGLTPPISPDAPIARSAHRGVAPVRQGRGRDPMPVPAQVVLAPPAYAPRPSSPRRPVPARQSRGRAVTPIPPQVFLGPAYPVRSSSPRRVWSPARWGRRSPVPFVAPDGPVRDVVTRRPPAGRPARGRSITPVPAQVLLAPSFVPRPSSPRRPAGWLSRSRARAPLPLESWPVARSPRRAATVRPTRGRDATTVPPVQTVTFGPQWVPQRPGRRVLAGWVRRSGRGDLTPPTGGGDAVPAAVEHRRPPVARPARGRSVLPVQPTVLSPPIVLRPSSPRRPVAAVVRRVRPWVAPAPTDPLPRGIGQLTARRAPAVARRGRDVVPPVPVQTVLYGPAWIPQRPRRAPLVAVAGRRRPPVAPVAQEAPAPTVLGAAVRRRPAPAVTPRRRQQRPPVEQAPKAGFARTALARRLRTGRRGGITSAYPWIGVGLPAGIRPGRMGEGWTRGASADAGTTKGTQITAGYRTSAAADTADGA